MIQCILKPSLRPNSKSSIYPVRVSFCSLIFFDDAISFFLGELNTCALSSIFTRRQVLFLLSSIKYLLRHAYV